MTEDQLSGYVSNETYRALLACGAELESPRLVAAMLTGELDGLARYVCAVQMTNTTPEQIAQNFAAQFERLVHVHHNTPQGEA